MPERERCCPAPPCGIKAPLSCLTQARYGITWGVIGAAQACLAQVLDYSQTRVLFGRPLAATQAIQIRLAEMARRITTAQLLSLQLGRLKDEGTMSPSHVSLAKWNNCRMALDVARDARDILGGCGHQRRVRADPARAQPRERHHVRRHRDDPPADDRSRADRHQRVLTRRAQDGQASPGWGARRGNEAEADSACVSDPRWRRWR